MTARKVLVVDDDDDVRESVADLLRVRGHQVTLARDGQEALERIASELPEVILLDMRMPIMNGWEFARRFHEQHDHLARIVVLTAATDAQERAEEIGAEGWLGKPFESRELYAAIDCNRR